MTLGATGRRSAASEAEQFRETAPTGARIGISLSGGGIRSAAFNLGALQALQENRILQRADYLAAVSGGNYIGSALTISNAYSGKGDGLAPWSAGSPEEHYLRNNTDYMAPGFTGRVWFALSTAYGFLLNYLPFLLSAYLVGRALGWIVHAVGLSLAEMQFSGFTFPTSWVLRWLLVALGVCIAVALLLVMVRRFRDRYESVAEYGKSRAERLAGASVGAALMVIVAIVLPALAAGYATASRWLLETVLGAPPEEFETLSGRLEVSTFWLVLALGGTGLALVLSRGTRGRRIMLGVSAVSGAALLLIPLLSSLEHAARVGLRPYDIVTAGIALTVVLVLQRHFGVS